MVHPMNLEMIPIEILGLKADLQAVIHTLRRLGCVHIEELNELPEISARPLTLDRDTVRHQEELSLLVARMGGLLETLGGAYQKPERLASENYLAEARAGVDELMPKVKALSSQREHLESELGSLP